MNASPSREELDELRTALMADDDGASALGWPAVHAFEAEHGIELPEPYRTLVAEVSDGSFAGPPDHGLLGLAEMPADWGAGRPARDLARPFPLAEAWVWEDDPRPEEELDALLAPVFDHGSVVLGTDGCGSYWHLIVTGPQRGQIWNICGEGAAPVATDGFLGWVRRWSAGEAYD